MLVRRTGECQESRQIEKNLATCTVNKVLLTKSRLGCGFLLTPAAILFYHFLFRSLLLLLCFKFMRHIDCWQENVTLNTSFHCLQVLVTKNSTILSSGSDKSWSLINDEHYYYIAFKIYKSVVSIVRMTFCMKHTIVVGHLKFECGFVSDSV